MEVRQPGSRSTARPVRRRHLRPQRSAPAPPASTFRPCRRPICRSTSPHRWSCTSPRRTPRPPSCATAGSWVCGAGASRWTTPVRCTWWACTSSRGGWLPFLGLPLTGLRHQLGALRRLSGGSFLVARLRDRLANAGSTLRSFACCWRQELRSRLGRGGTRAGLPLVHHAARRLAASWGQERVGALAAAGGVSSDQLAAQFKAHVGLTPKRVARIYRFARVILTVDARRPIDWAQLAPAVGYFDQAHLSKNSATSPATHRATTWSCAAASPSTRVPARPRAYAGLADLTTGGRSRISTSTAGAPAAGSAGASRRTEEQAWEP